MKYEEISGIIYIMRDFFCKQTVFLPLFLVLAPLAGAQDTRNTPISVNLIIDGSQALKNAGAEPLNWICDYLVERVLSDDDFLTIWNAAGSAGIVFSDTVKNGGGKEGIKTIIRSLGFEADRADFAGALREAASRPRAAGAFTYTILICGSSAALTPSLLGSGAGYLRYSRVEEHSRWRILTIALDAESRIKQAAAAYMTGN
jgi:hypothetical protein